MRILTALIAIILTLLLVIGIHEAGHAIVAYFFKVPIKRISIGFGKPLLSWKDKSQREWVWALWPLGGYVALLNSRIEPVPPKVAPYAFDKQAIWVRICILLAGIIANIIMAWILFTVIFLLGFKQPLPIIKEVLPQTMAANAGLQSQDRFVEVSGKKTDSWQEVLMLFMLSLNKPGVDVIVQDIAGKTKKVFLPIGSWKYNKKDRSFLHALGMLPFPPKVYVFENKAATIWQASCLALSKIVQIFSFFLSTFKLLFTGYLPFAILLGPMGLLVTSVLSFWQGFVVFLYFIAALSLAVAFTNILPIPGLDGGSLLYTIIEKIRGKPMSIAMEVLLYRLALIFFVLLFIQLLMNDLKNYLT